MCQDPMFARLNLSVTWERSDKGYHIEWMSVKCGCVWAAIRQGKPIKVVLVEHSSEGVWREGSSS